jgi:hypothetical protein
MMELMQGLSDNVLGIVGSGTITGEDYETVLIPAMKDKLQKYKKIRLIYQVKQGLCTLCNWCILRRCKSIMAYTFIRESRSRFRCSLDKRFC